MADDNKVTIELDLETKDFQVKIGDVTQGFDRLGNKGGFSLESIGMKFLAVNQAIELGKKAIELFNEGVEKMAQSEKMQNQATALNNLTSQIGVNSQAVVEAIKKAAGDSVTSIQATQAAFKLLSSGVRADQIPALVAWADKLEDSGTKNVTFMGTIEAVSRAMEMGSTRGLKEYGIATEKAGDRQQVLNSIMAQAKIQSDKLGEGYVDLGDRIKTKMSEAADSTTKFFGGIAKSAFGSFFQTDAEKATNALKNYQEQLDRLNKYEEENKDKLKSWEAERIRINQERALLEERIEKAKGRVTEGIKKETEETEKLNSQLTQEKDVKLRLTQYEQQKVELQARIISAIQQGRDEEKEYGMAAMKSINDVYNLKKQKIDQDYQDRKLEAQTSAESAIDLRNKLVAIENDRIDKIRALRVDDETFKKAQSQAEIKDIENNLLTADSALERHRNSSLQQETEAHNKRLEMLRQEELTKEQFYKKMEVEEANHQKNLSNIKAQYETINTRNLQLGLNTSLNQMRNQFGSFTNFVSSATTKTHSIMSKGFVDLAKGHGDAMEKMLGQFLEMIGTQMIESGTYHLLMGIWPPNPAELGQGAALIAAGSALVGAGGGGGSSGGDSGSGSSFGGDVTTAPSAPIKSPDQATPEQINKKQASIIINGDFLNSRETANHLAEVIRQNSDITDYSITAQGRNYG